MATIKVTVIVDKFGSYSKGDVIEMEETTAAACAKNKKVSFDGMAKPKAKKVEKNEDKTEG